MPYNQPEREQFRGLARFALSDQELIDLARQGSVSQEFRGARGPFFKLRFRSGGRQRVLYLGKDPIFAATITAELQQLQRGRRLEIDLNHLAREVRKVLRQTKQELEKDVRDLGLVFHGLIIRDRSNS